MKRPRYALVLAVAITACAAFASPAMASSSKWSCKQLQNDSQGEQVFRCSPRATSNEGKARPSVIVEGKGLTITKAEIQAEVVYKQTSSEGSESGSASESEAGGESGGDAVESAPEFIEGGAEVAVEAIAGIAALFFGF